MLPVWTKPACKLQQFSNTIVTWSSGERRGLETLSDKKRESFWFIPFCIDFFLFYFLFMYFLSNVCSFHIYFLHCLFSQQAARVVVCSMKLERSGSNGIKCNTLFDADVYTAL